MNFRSNKAFLTCKLLFLFVYFSISLGQLKFPPYKITILNGGMNFYFKFFESNKTVLMGLEMNKTVDYFAIGFANKGNWGMKNFDMVAFVFSATGSTTIMDLYSTEFSQPPTDTSLGGTSDYTLINSYVSNGKTQVLFERAYDTGDKYDFTFHPDQNASIVFAWSWLSNGQHELAYHGPNAGNFISPMYNGLNSQLESESSDNETIVKIHSYMLLFTWAILIDIAIWIARYHKSWKYVIVVHLCLMLLIYAMTITMTILMLTSEMEDDEESSTLSAHHYIGLIILGIILLQVIIGFIYGYKLVRSKVTKTIPFLSYIHLYLGILIYLVAKTQIMIGLYLWKSQFLGALGGWYGVLLVCWLFREYIYRQRSNLIKNKVKTSKAKGQKAKKYAILMNLLNTNTPVSNIIETPELKGLKWAILDNNVFEIKDFTHPGGNFILKEIQGREIGRFIYGVIGLEPLIGNFQHRHRKAVNSVVKKNFIGTIKNDQQLLIPLSPPLSNKLKPLWTLLNKIELSSHTTKYEFECLGYKIDPWVKDIRHIGRHMKVSCKAHSKTRLYTLVLCQTECRTQRRNLLLNKTEKGALLAADLLKSHSNVLPLIVRRYHFPKSKAFSSFLHEAKANIHRFIIEGPFGTGFGLTPQSTGLHYIFAAGTGIFPFLDLFDYLLEIVLIPSSNSNIFKNGFKLQIFASFVQLRDFVGLEICEKLIQACRDSGMEDAVKMTIRAKDARETELFEVTKETFDIAFVQKYVESDCEQVYVCGTPIFNQQIPLALRSIGLSKTKIMLV